MKTRLLLAFLSLPFLGFSQNSINLGIQGISFGVGSWFGPTLAYTIELGDKASITPIGYFFNGKNPTNIEYYNYYTYNDVESISLKHQIYGTGLSFKRYGGKSNNNETGGFYFGGLFGIAWGTEKLIIPAFDTSQVEYIVCNNLGTRFYSSGEYVFERKNIFRGTLILGYDMEIADSFLLFFEGFWDSYLKRDELFEYSGFLLHIGIRKRFYKL